MKEKETNRIRRVTLRLKPKEYEMLEKKCKSSTCRNLSEYIRLALLHKPITILERNQSQDEMMGELTRVRTELNRVGNNFNQATKKLHSLSQISEFKAWLVTQETEKQTLLFAVEEVKIQVDKLADQWLR